jgi:hypothetical protein
MGDARNQDAVSGIADSGGTLPYLGSIFVENRSSAQAGAFYEAFASFGTVAALKALGCSGTTSGNCCYGPITLPPAATSAGSIALHDGATSLGTLMFAAGAYTALVSTSTPSLTWKNGDNLSVCAQGNASGVAAFSGAVIAPSPLAGVSPVFSSATINVSTTSD